MAPEPCNPAPKGCQVEPFQRAMWLAATPPATVNSPPAIKSPLKVVRQYTALLGSDPGAPSLRQEAPSHAAMQLEATPPAVVKFPPTTSSATPPGGVQTVEHSTM